MGNELGQHISQSQKTGILQLRGFKLEKVPPEILQIAQFLRNLDLSNNKIPQMPINLFTRMQALKTLNLSSNRLDSLPNDISSLTKLETLNVSENSLEMLPTTINKCQNLKTINLSKNKLSQIQKELCTLKQLDHLDLSLNKVERVEDYVENITCIEINLNENRVKFISASVAKCKRLKVLRLEQNVLDLKALPTALLADSNVSLLALDGNLFTPKQFEQAEGYEKYMERYTATRRKFD